MKIFITGATGFIGLNLALKLASSGLMVHALYRSESKALLLQHENIKLFKGDISDRDSIAVAMQSCQEVYHLAAFVNVWEKDKKQIYDLNVTSTINIIDIAVKLGIKKIVFTSTAGVFGPSLNNTINEQSISPVAFFTEYERTKSIAEQKIIEYVKKGTNIVIVNPTRVYGPGLLNQSNGLTKIVKSYLSGKWRIIPGNGKSIGNYVFIDDVVNGHILAMKKGAPGEKYILGGTNASYNEFFRLLAEVSQQRHYLIKLPFRFMLVSAYFMQLLAKFFGIPPVITPSLVRKFDHDWNISSEKAENELGYVITPLETGIKKTIDWLKSDNRFKKNRS